MESIHPAWWKEAVVYQIYPRSFKDSNGDGIGDLNGIREKLDYLKDLGVDVLWLNPIYQSPNVDNGYDISDYRDIMTDFGTMADFDALLADVHAHGLKLIMDLVVNHSSDQHPWFIESRSGRDNPKRDYYIWKDPAPDGGAPNNWRSCFSGSAWKYDEKTGQYYLHLFAEGQPDLNWENPEVRDQVFDMMNFWFQKGIDGFRMDVISMISKAGYADGPLCADGLYGDYTDQCTNGPRVHEYLQEMNRRVLSHYDCMTVGENANVNPELACLYAGEDRHELNMVFQFELMDVDGGESVADFMKAANYISREHTRTPMHWDDTANAGFTTGTPWIPLNPNYPQINAAKQVGDPDSVYSFYRRLLALRKSDKTFVYGHYALLLPDDEEIYAYTRTLNDEQILVVCNFTDHDVPCPLLNDWQNTELLISNYNTPGNPGSLRPFEAVVYRK